jgi:hypothetical protein
MVIFSQSLNTYALGEEGCAARFQFQSEAREFESKSMRKQLI